MTSLILAASGDYVGTTITIGLIIFAPVSYTHLTLPTTPYV